MESFARFETGRTAHQGADQNFYSPQQHHQYGNYHTDGRFGNYNCQLMFDQKTIQGHLKTGDLLEQKDARIQELLAKLTNLEVVSQKNVNLCAKTKEFEDLEARERELALQEFNLEIGNLEKAETNNLEAPLENIEKFRKDAEEMVNLWEVCYYRNIKNILKRNEDKLEAPCVSDQTFWMRQLNHMKNQYKVENEKLQNELKKTKLEAKNQTESASYWEKKYNAEDCMLQCQLHSNMFQPPSQEIKQPLVSSTQSPSKTSTPLWENFDESGWSRACDKFMLASIDITHLDGTFPASPGENSTGPLTVENDQAPPFPDVQENSDDEVKSLDVKYVESRKIYNQAQTQPHSAQFQQQVQQSQPQQTHQAALPVVMPAPQAPLLQRPQKLVLQGHQSPLPGIQMAPQATVSAPSTPMVPIVPVFNPVLSPFNLSTMASHTRINVDLLSKDLWKQQPQLQQIHQAVLPVAMPVPQIPLQQQSQKLVLQGHQSPLPIIQPAPQAAISAPSTPNVPITPVINPVLSPFNPFVMASHTQINVELLSKDIWKLFHGLQNEMCVTNSGRELFPQLQYKVSGLNKRQQYKFVLWLERTDPFEFDWNRQLKQYERSNKQDVGNAITNPVFTNIRTGQEWEDSKVNFADVNLYNVGNPSKSEKAMKNDYTESKRKFEQKKTSKLSKPRICVSLNCKYNPVLAVYEVANGALIHRGKFQFEETSFIVVSMYRNPVLCAHKTALNKSVSKEKRADAERMLKEYNEEHSQAESGSSTSSDATLSPPVSSQCFGANGSSLSTSSG